MNYFVLSVSDVDVEVCSVFCLGKLKESSRMMGKAPYFFFLEDIVSIGGETTKEGEGLKNGD